jgi:hypothetical protein
MVLCTAATVLVSQAAITCAEPGKESPDTSASKSILERLLPAPKNAGFRMPGYFVWCGSVIKVEGTYHLFASRWPKETKFPNGYRTHSEIVRATAKTPEGPYEFQEVVASGRGGAWWDGKMCHNPKIVQAGDTYVLYYIGSAVGSPLRKVGYAWSKSITGPWQRIDEPLPLGEDHNNPAPYVHADGRILMAFRDQNLRMSIAVADRFDGTYKVVASDLFPGIRVEDPDLSFFNGRYQMVAEDNQGKFTGAERHGVHFVSDDGIHWRKNDPIKVYTHTLTWTDGTTTKADRRERPELFNANAACKGNGTPTHLLTAVLVGDETWCTVQPIASP